MANKTVYPFGTDGQLPSSIGIINDPYTGGVDKAASAEIVKKLNADINDIVEQDISSLSLVQAGISTTTDKWYTNPDNKCKFLPVTPGRTYVVHSPEDRGVRIAILKSTSHTEGTTADYATGCELVLIPRQTYQSFTIPSDGNYMYILVLSNGNDCTPQGVYLESFCVSIDRNSLVIEGEKVLDGIGFNSGLRGIGDTLVAVRMQLVRGEKYRLHIVNPSWPRTSATGTNSILIIRAWVNGAWASSLVNVKNGSSVEPYYDFVMPTCEYLQLGIRADVGEFVYFRLEKPYSSVPVATTDEYRNAHIALMNKYAERYGAVLSTFMAANGSSKVCAKDIALLGLAAIENNIISSFWGEKVVNAPVFGPNARLDTYESTYTDEASHPMVADLSDYYHIFGGKTGSGGTPSQGRNLVVAVKSKVDDAWLVGCVLYSTADTQGDNRFSVMKQLFDLLEQHRTGAAVDASSLRCQGAYAFVVPEEGNTQNYGDYPFVSVGKNETGIIDSHSIVKLLTALVATDWLSPYEMLTFTSEDPYGGTSGNMYADGDQLYAIDALISMNLTSSSIAARCIARYVGMKVLEKNGGAKLYSFRLLGRTAYGVGTQTWLEWLASPDYLAWSAETGITLSCSGSSASVNISTGGSLSGATGGSSISANTIYNS